MSAHLSSNLRLLAAHDLPQLASIAKKREGERNLEGAQHRQPKSVEKKSPVSLVSSRSSRSPASILPVLGANQQERDATFGTRVRAGPGQKKYIYFKQKAQKKQKNKKGAVLRARALPEAQFQFLVCAACGVKGQVLAHTEAAHARVERHTDLVILSC